MLTRIEKHIVEQPKWMYIREDGWHSCPVGSPEQPTDGFASDLDKSVREMGIIEVYHCDSVRWNDDGHMVTGPEVYARFADGHLVRATHYIALEARCYEPVDAIPEISQEAIQRKADHFRSLYAAVPEHQEPGGLEATVTRAMELF